MRTGYGACEGVSGSQWVCTRTTVMIPARWSAQPPTWNVPHSVCHRGLARVRLFLDGSGNLPFILSHLEPTSARWSATTAVVLSLRHRFSHLTGAPSYFSKARPRVAASVSCLSYVGFSSGCSIRKQPVAAKMQKIGKGCTVGSCTPRPDMIRNMG